MFQYSGTHAGSSAGAGGHSHTLGSQNITGSFVNKSDGNSIYDGGTGAFRVYAATEYNYRDDGGHSGYPTRATFNANQGWSGASNTVANHSHTITVNNTGGGKAHNNMQPYLVVNIWKRTK